jgi:molybdate-binding protein
VLACCDPAVGLLAHAFQQNTPFRLIVLVRSSTEALCLLRQGLIHVAGLHLAQVGDASDNAAFVKQQLGSGFDLLRITRWEEGVVLSPQLGVHSVEAALRSNLRWVGREPGSGARRRLDELLQGRSTPLHTAAGHRGVAEAVHAGWADAGVCLRLAGEEAGTDFLPVWQEDYDLCCTADFGADPRMQALIEAVRSRSYRSLLNDLPGYDASSTGELQLGRG